MTDRDVPSHDELPLSDYDHLPTGSLAARVRSLDADQLGALLAYERAHGDRLDVTQVLETRLAELRDGAEPTSGSADGPRPEQAGPPEATQKASPQTQGPPVNPPSHGDPTNPAQPRS